MTDDSPSSQPHSLQPTPLDDFRAEVDEKRLAKEQNQLILNRQRLRDGCLDMDRITRDILSPEILSAATLMKSNGTPLEVIELETESPLDQEIYLLGMRLRFGNKELPTKVSFEADPETHIFHLYTRVHEEEAEELIAFHELIPSHIHEILTRVFREVLPDLNYQPKVIPDIFSTDSFKAPYRVLMEEEGETANIATTETLKEAIKMGSTFSSIYKKNDTLRIVDADESLVC